MPAQKYHGRAIGAAPPDRPNDVGAAPPDRPNDAGAPPSGRPRATGAAAPDRPEQTGTDPLRAAREAFDLANSDPERSIRAARVALASGWPEPVALARRALAIVAAIRGELADSERLLRASIAGAQTAGLAVRAAEARGTLAYVLTLRGRTSAALRELDRAASALTGAAAARLAMQRGTVLTELRRPAPAEIAFAQALRLTVGEPLLEGDIRTNRSLLRIQQSDFAGARADLRAAQEKFTAAGHQGRIAAVQHDLALVEAGLGDVPAALAAFAAAEAGFAAMGRSAGLLPVEKAELLLSVLLVDEARQAAELAVTRFAAESNRVDLVQARLVLARAELLTGDTGTAAAQAGSAGREARAQHRPGWAALAGYLAFRAAVDAGAATVAAGRRLLPRLVEAGWPAAALDVRLALARLRIAQQRPDLAAAELRAVGRPTGSAEVRVRTWTVVALARTLAGDDRGALRAAQAGFGVLESFRAGIGATELRVQVSGHAGELAELALAAAVRSGSARRLLTWSERTRANALRLPPVRPPAGADLAADLAALRTLAGSASASERRQQVRLERSVRDRARLLPGAGAADRLATVPELTQALGDAVLVELVASAGVLFAVVLRRGRVRRVDLGPVAPVLATLDALRFGLRRQLFLGSTTRRTEFSATAADALDATVLGGLGLGDAELVVVPTGALHALPWALLPRLAGRPVTVAPSARAWWRARSRPVRPGPAVLVAGPDLPRADVEVRDIDRLYPDAIVLTGAAASAGALSRAVPGAGLLHVAAHGRLRSDNPLFSALELADGPWTGYDLESAGGAPPLVVLSACDVGRSPVRAGGELLGLSAVFLGLGTRTLIAAVLPVPDELCASVMVDLHTRLRQGQPPAAALAGAQAGLGSAAAFVCLGAG